MNHYTRALALICFFFTPFTYPFAQVPYTANTHTTTYNFPFAAGANLGVYPGWSDENLAALITGDAQLGLDGVGGTTVRPALPMHFLEQWGYDIRKNAFAYYRNIGMKPIVAFVGYPDDAHREPTQFCPGSKTEMFKNMYAPIWDDGANGTPVNDTNYYALYLWKIAETYGDYIDIWEITNEPDLTGSPAAYLGPDKDDSWWNRDPEPCELAIKAPIQYYIRMLRIAYEVIKTAQPDDFIATGGIGYPSFLDAILRNTDNPDQGKSSPEYPLKGGAYFDVLSFHTYPHIDNSMRQWSDAIGGFVYSRHSDKAVDNGYLKNYHDFRQVLENHHFTGTLFPKKHFIVTETNIPRKSFGEYIGSDEAQRNYTMKVLLKSMAHDIHAVHFFTIAEEGSYFSGEFSYMGLYQKLGASPSQPVQLTEQGIAFKTTTQLTKGYIFDADATAALNLPPDADGIVLKNQLGKRLYALWAKTHQDRNEQAQKTLTLTGEDPHNVLVQYDWNYSVTGQADSIPGNVITLTGTPRFFRPIGQVKLAFEIRPILFPNPADVAFELSYNLFDDAPVSADLYDIVGHHIKNVVPKSNQIPGHYSYNVNTETLTTGIYILKIQARKQRIAIPVLVQHY